MAEVGLKRLPLIVLGVFVCLTAMFAGALFGAISAALYHTAGRPDMGAGASHDIPTRVGVIAGVASGLLAGAYWTVRMGRRIARGVRGRFRLVLEGGGWGLVVGAGSALLTHVALNITWAVAGEEVNILAGLSFIAIGLAWGAVVGFFTGFVCGVLALGATLRLRPDAYWESG